MDPAAPKRLRMFAGPNGSGKTTLARRFAVEFSTSGLFHLYRFVNADEIYETLRSGGAVPLEGPWAAANVDEVRAALVQVGRLQADHPMLVTLHLEEGRLLVKPDACDAYGAATVADLLRESLLEAGASFSFETVMSHPSKIEFLQRAQAAGYRTYVYFVATDSPELNVIRVEDRIKSGGHSVPPEKIVPRYERCLALAQDALRAAHRAFVFDTSGEEPLWLAELHPDGALQLKCDPSVVPKWFNTWIAPGFPAPRG